jgi:superfamily II DNA or RNA helicase
MILEVSNLTTKICTDNPDLLRSLIDMYSFNDPAAFYARNKRGWDGKKRFITQTGTIKTGLVPRLIEDLKRVDLVPEIVLKSSSVEIEIPLELKLPKWDFRDYQVNILKDALKQKRGIVKAPTGAGKTSLIAYLVHLFKDKKVLILFNKKQLLVQCYEFLKSIGIETGLCFGEGYIPSNIMLCTVQSIEKIVGLPVEKPDLLIVDEVHEFGSGKFTSQVINSFPSAQYRFGFTATVPTDNIKRYTIEGAFGPVIESVSTQKLIEQGYLAKPNIKVLNVSYDPSSTLNLDVYLDRYKELIVNNPRRNGLIGLICSSIDHPNPKIAIIVQSLDHASILLNMLPNAKKIEGLNSIEERQKAIKWFRSANRPILIGTNILQTGIDIKEITHLIIARGLKSDIPTIQALGRALRIDRDSEVFVYDFYDRDGGLLEKHSRARIRAYKREGHKPEII